jgi:hypothetical protein
VRLIKHHDITGVVTETPKTSRSVWLRDIRYQGEPMFDANETLPIVDISHWEQIP